MDGAQRSLASTRLRFFTLFSAQSSFYLRGGRKSLSSTPLPYNNAADMYSQVVQKRDQPLREGFWIVKVHATCMLRTR